MVELSVRGAVRTRTPLSPVSLLGEMRRAPKQLQQ